MCNSSLRHSFGFCGSLVATYYQQEMSRHFSKNTCKDTCVNVSDGKYKEGWDNAQGQTTTTNPNLKEQHTHIKHKTDKNK